MIDRWRVEGAKRRPRGSFGRAARPAANETAGGNRQDQRRLGHLGAPRLPLRVSGTDVIERKRNMVKGATVHRERGVANVVREDPRTTPPPSCGDAAMRSASSPSQLSTSGGRAWCLSWGIDIVVLYYSALRILHSIYLCAYSEIKVIRNTQSGSDKSYLPHDPWDGRHRNRYRQGLCPERPAIRMFFS